MLRLFCFLAVVLGVQSALAPFIKPCKAGDNECMKSSAQAVVSVMAPGIPALGISSLDPMRFDEIKSNQGGLNLSFKDTVVTGMKGCTVEDIKHDVRKSKQHVTIRCSVDLNGNYKLSGQLLVLPIEGNGKYHIEIRDIVIKTITELETVTGADGKSHWDIKARKHSYQVKTIAKFSFENLFNGNKALAKPVEDFVNVNWRDVMKEVAPPIVHAIVDRTIDGVQELYKAVPVEELVVQ